MVVSMDFTNMMYHTAIAATRATATAATITISTAHRLSCVINIELGNYRTSVE